MRLFTVEYTDGTVFKQGKEDVSKLDPKRSAFYDVLHSDKEIKSFSIGDLKVNLLDGSFTINGLKVYAEDQSPVKRDLIFFRQHQHDFNNNYQADKKGIFQFLSGEETNHRITYFVGYEVKGQKTVLGIK